MKPPRCTCSVYANEPSRWCPKHGSKYDYITWSDIPLVPESVMGFWLPDGSFRIGPAFIHETL